MRKLLFLWWFLFVCLVFFKEKQFAVDLWLLLSIFPFYKKEWGFKINLSSTSRAVLPKQLSWLNESSENLTVKVASGAGVHSNHF